MIHSIKDVVEDIVNSNLIDEYLSSTNVVDTS